MIDITKKLPISLITLMNSFNDKLIPLRKQMELISTSNKVRLNSSDYENIKTKYIVKNSEFFFEINFLINGDYIDWNYYPNVKDSSKKSNQGRIAFDQKIYDRLKSDLEKWEKNILVVNELSNPVEFFTKDKIIEFYSKEIIEKIPFNEYEEEFPLHSDKQDLAIILIDKQIKFIETELKGIKDKSSEKHQDLTNAKTNLSELKENMSQMTISEVKKKWSLSFGTIIKWLKAKFIQFLNIDKASGNDISRLIGGFIGGVFGVPKVE
tara:strand:+ start:447 stop:1244 length:798 start_codon:yes stop_codon:yes gene_type:complete